MNIYKIPRYKDSKPVLHDINGINARILPYIPTARVQ
jgi:hypothetical protein